MKCCNRKGPWGFTRVSWKVFQSYPNTRFIGPPLNWKGKACVKVKAKVRPGQKKCKEDVIVKGSEDKERDTPQDSGCWSSASSGNGGGGGGWSRREGQAASLPSSAPNQRWEQKDPDSCPMLCKGACSVRPSVCPTGALSSSVQLALSPVPHICVVSLALVLFHLPADLRWLFQRSQALLVPYVIGRQSLREWPGVGCFHLEGLYIFHGLLWGPGARPPLLGVLPGHRRTVALARNQFFFSMTLWRNDVIWEPAVHVLP